MIKVPDGTNLAARERKVHNSHLDSIKKEETTKHHLRTTNTLQTDKHDYTSFPFLWRERRLPRIQHFAELIENSLGEKKPTYFKK